MDPMGPNGETIMDYAVRYAAESGYGKTVFVIRRSMEEDFRRYVLPRYADSMSVDYVFQELDMLPEGFTLNEERKKPYGTAHAILVAKDAVHEPFTVINADDFYGKEAFGAMAAFLHEEQSSEHPVYAMVGYRLDKTLSDNGTVSRGVCSTDENGFLKTIEENRKIARMGNVIENLEEGRHRVFSGEEPVSMNFWGFTPAFFNCLEGLFSQFLKENQQNVTAEFPIPDVISYLMNNGLARIKVLHSQAEWFGVTYQEDRPVVVEKLKHIG